MNIDNDNNGALTTCQDAAIVMGMVLLAETSSLIGEGPRKKGL